MLHKHSFWHITYNPWHTFDMHIICNEPWSLSYKYRTQGDRERDIGKGDKDRGKRGIGKENYRMK